MLVAVDCSDFHFLITNLFKLWVIVCDFLRFWIKNNYKIMNEWHWTSFDNVMFLYFALWFPIRENISWPCSVWIVWSKKIFLFTVPFFRFYRIMKTNKVIVRLTIKPVNVETIISQRAWVNWSQVHKNKWIIMKMVKNKLLFFCSHEMTLQRRTIWSFYSNHVNCTLYVHEYCEYTFTYPLQTKLLLIVHDYQIIEMFRCIQQVTQDSIH